MWHKINLCAPFSAAYTINRWRVIVGNYLGQDGNWQDSSANGTHGSSCEDVVVCWSVIDLTGNDTRQIDVGY